MTTTSSEADGASLLFTHNHDNIKYSKGLKERTFRSYLRSATAQCGHLRITKEASLPRLRHRPPQFQSFRKVLLRVRHWEKSKNNYIHHNLS